MTYSAIDFLLEVYTVSSCWLDEKAFSYFYCASNVMFYLFKNG